MHCEHDCDDDDVEGDDYDVDGGDDDVDGGDDDQVGVKLCSKGQDNLVPGCKVVSICHPNLIVVPSSTLTSPSHHIIHQHVH